MKENLLKIKNKIYDNIKSKKEIIAYLLLAVTIIFIVGSLVYYRVNYGLGMSVKDKNKKICEFVDKKEYTNAIDLNNRYFYPENLKNILEYNENVRFIDADYLKYNNIFPYDVKGIDYQDKLDFKLDLMERLSGDYYKITARITNNGDESIRYIKLGFKFFDKDEKPLNSNFTNYEIPCYDRISPKECKTIVGYIKQENLQTAKGNINELILNSQKIRVKE